MNRLAMSEESMFDNNDALFSSKMLKRRAIKQNVHSGIIAIASPTGGILYVPFELTDEGFRESKKNNQCISYLLDSVKESFMSGIFGDKYK